MKAFERGKKVKEENITEISYLFANELCEEGWRLWDTVDYHSLLGGECSYRTKMLNGYLKHLLVCNKCQEGLELGENDLGNIKEVIEKREGGKEEQ